MYKAGCLQSALCFLIANNDTAVAVLLQTNIFSADVAMNEFHLWLVLL
jgi:hypothetical protein